MKKDGEFSDRVYWIVSQLPYGCVATYGQIAAYAGSARAARAVGNLMRQSLHNQREIPWHRVINAKGGISARGETQRAELQYRLLKAEGIEFSPSHYCDLDTYRWVPGEAFWND